MAPPPQPKAMTDEHQMSQVAIRQTYQHGEVVWGILYSGPHQDGARIDGVQ